ncbi:DUF5686 and carboxypeptidase regulatory-like domain-containing protein [Adhaeribacter radiodurans]|uniref:Carboxypeptidase-like regulatory domain-containing protein n=1 Tax=Adhaeribacter radiodurans TaxID=2745197 RepID=A0A7L7LD93_9BACT|nr:DUF5686 and carboxypeptidase regulatory-like domain-containing protein [Adhaeribacter radiodurans]QMU30808.1 carboxypeptidase-like regulatory domain-containing protein [Adhaeribacter radiodurans]
MPLRLLLFLNFFFFISPLVEAGLFKGRVTDAQGDGLAYANVYVKNSTIGTATNEQGYYQLTLAPGTYQMVYQYVGYKAQVDTIEITTEPVEHNVTLQPDVYNLNEVVVRASDKDPAYAIMQAAIARRKYHQNEVAAYSCRVYTKGLGRLLKVPNRVMGFKVDDVKPGIVYLSETVSEVNFRQPNKTHERMLSSKVSGDTKGFSFNRASRVNFNFYDNLLRIPGLSERAFVSPLANNAFLFYRYKLIGTSVENGQTINKIKVTPIRGNDPAFNGFIYILEDSYRLYSTSLKLTQKSQIEYADTLRIDQVFGPVKDGIWMLFSQKLTVQFDSFGFKGNGFFTTVYSKYNVVPAYSKPVAIAPPATTANAPAPVEPEPPIIKKSKLKKLAKQKLANLDSTTTFIQPKNELMRVEPNANKRDTAYWDDIRPIPLTLEEQKDYVSKDSLQQIQESKPYRDSVDKRGNQFEVGNIFLSGYRYRNSFKHYSISVDPLLAVLNTNSILQYNTVEGTVLNLGVRYRKGEEETNKGLTIAPTLRYGFASKKLYGRLLTNYYYNPHRFAQITAEAGHFVAQYNSNDAISPFWNALYTLLYEQNFLKIYQKTNLLLRHNLEIRNGIYLTTSLEYADRQQLQNASDFTFKDYTNKQFTSNIPVNAELPDASFARNQALVGSVTLQLRPGQKYINRPDEKWILGSKYPTFRINYTKGFSRILGSDVDFDRVSLNVSDELNLGLVGATSYSFQAGTFLNNKRLYFTDYKHFAGNRILYAGAFGGFQLLDYYRYSTRNRYLEGHFTHDFNGFIFNKIPLFRKLKWQEVFSANYLHTQRAGHYIELGVGVEHIFKILRVDFFTGFQSREKVGSGIRLGFGI